MPVPVHVSVDTGYGRLATLALGFSNQLDNRPFLLASTSHITHVENDICAFMNSFRRCMELTWKSRSVV